MTKGLLKEPAWNEATICRRAKALAKDAIQIGRVAGLARGVFAGATVGGGIHSRPIAAGRLRRGILHTRRRGNTGSGAGRPDGFIGGLPERVILDEVQRVPDLFRARKWISCWKMPAGGWWESR
jgi:hypothetical protein